MIRGLVAHRRQTIHAGQVRRRPTTPPVARHTLRSALESPPAPRPCGRACAIAPRAGCARPGRGRSAAAHEPYACAAATASAARGCRAAPAGSQRTVDVRPVAGGCASVTPEFLDFFQNAQRRRGVLLNPGLRFVLPPGARGWGRVRIRQPDCPRSRPPHAAQWVPIPPRCDLRRRSSSSRLDHRQHARAVASGSVGHASITARKSGSTCSFECEVSGSRTGADPSAPQVPCSA
jgi:hypothetical protein